MQSVFTPPLSSPQDSGTPSDALALPISFKRKRGTGDESNPVEAASWNPTSPTFRTCPGDGAVFLPLKGTREQVAQMATPSSTAIHKLAGAARVHYPALRPARTKCFDRLISSNASSTKPTPFIFRRGGLQKHCAASFPTKRYQYVAV